MITIVSPRLYRLLVRPFDSPLENILGKKRLPPFSKHGTQQVSKPINLICEIKFGSHLYGTSTPTSDEDFKGLFMPTVKEVLLGRIPRTFHEDGRDDTRRNLPGERDVEYHSLHNFLRLATQGQTMAIDMLFAPSGLVYKTAEFGWIWDRLVAERKRFLSKQMHAFVGYARGQAAKYSLKGDRLNRLREFETILAHAVASEPLSVYWDLLPRDGERTNKQGIRELQISGKWYGENTSTENVWTSVNNSLKRYGARANAAANAEGVDWKALSHAVRVSKELQEIIAFGEIKFPLRDAPLLLAIKRGEHSLAYVQDLLDRDLAFIELNTERSLLPKKVDMQYWDNFLVDVMCEHISNELTRVLS